MSDSSPDKLVGKYRILGPDHGHRFQGWMLAETRPPAASSTPSAPSVAGIGQEKARLWIVTPERFLEEKLWQSHAPSLSWLKKHHSLQAEGLMRIGEVFRDANRLVIAVEGTEFSDLFEAGEGKALPADEAKRVVLGLARSLRSMHDAGLIHGRLSHAWIVKSPAHQVVLLRDPLFEPRNPLSKRASLFALSADAAARELFAAAPEFIIPQQLPTVQSDLYALGCIWYRLLSGKWPFMATKVKALMEAHATQPLITDPSWGLNASEQHALQTLCGKNPASRFGSVQELLVELNSSEVASTDSAVDRKSMPIEAKQASVESVMQSLSQLKKDRTKQRSKSKRPVWLLPTIGATCGALLLGLIAFLAIGSSDRSSKDALDATVAQLKPDGAKALAEKGSLPTDEQKPAVVDPLQQAFQVVEGDPSSLWLPPSLPEPCTLELFPLGAQAYLFLNTGLMFSQPVERQTLALLEPEFKSTWDWVQSQCGIPVSEMSELAWGYYPAEPGWPKWAMRVTLAQSRSVSELKQRWGEVQVEKVGEREMFVRGDIAFYLPKHPVMEADSISSFVLGWKDGMKEVAELEGAPGPLRRQMEQIWKFTDRQSDINLVVVPGFFETDARQAVKDVAPQFTGSLRRLFGNPWQACSVRCTLGDRLYVEMRGVAGSEAESGKGIQVWRDLFGSLGDLAEQQLQQNDVHPYWRPLALRMPTMLRSVAKYQRYGVERGQGITNIYLPSDAMSNLAMIAVLSAKPWSRSDESQAVTPAASVKTLTMDEILALPIDLRFDQQSFENAVRAVLEEINNAIPKGHPALRIVINGAAFEKEGITRNKEVRGFQFAQQPGRLALNDLIQKSNPETTDSLKSSKQKVVWIDLTSNPAEPTIQISTRRAVEEAKQALPAEFLEE